MKKQLLGFLLCAPWLAQAQAPAPFVLKGKLGKAVPSGKVYLWRPNVGFTDSAVVTNGRFELKGTVASPVQARLSLLQKGAFMRVRTGQADNSKFYLEKGTITFTSPDSLAHASIAGPKLTTEFEKLQTLLKPSNEKMKALMADYRAATPEQRKAPEFMKSMETRDEAISKEQNLVYEAFIKANTGSMVSLDAVKAVGGSVPNYAEIAPLFASLAPAVKDSPEGKKYGAKLEALKAVAIGAVAPDFTMNTPDGKAVALSSYRGKYVLVDFWASWCGPCRQENPNVTKVYNEYKTRNFDILGVSLDTEKARDKWLKAIQDDQLAWTQVSDLKGWQNAAATSYSVQAIPQNFLVDPSGKIVATNLRGDALKTTLAQFIK
ncbi:MAG TPA: TlpA disulfide reductase family protein [Hymenobacter sp.]|jgi:peroxiredoxin|uniref:TlpA disulfide reductase family protein n=1 Tax=Hymenobacter sp. TaxID=1898978 RepID=UPI002EDA32CC